LIKEKKEAAVTDMAIPLIHNLQTTITEKPRKYQDLEFEIKQQWQLTQDYCYPTGFVCCRGHP
jgi:hypothetical protein